MGSWISKITSLFQTYTMDKSARILMLGLDGSGKTTILYQMKLNERVQTIPTIGFNVETVEPVEGISFTVWDVGSQDKLRKLWRHYYPNTDGLCYVVDSVDLERISMARDELHWVMKEIYETVGRNVPVVVMANKQDIASALNTVALTDKLELTKLQSQWTIEATSGVTKAGLYESMEVMARFIREDREKGHSS